MEQTHCFLRTTGLPSPNEPVSVSSSVRSRVSEKDGQPAITLAPSTLKIVLAFGSDFTVSGNSLPRHGAALADGDTYLQLPADSESLTCIWSPFPVLGDFVVPVH